MDALPIASLVVVLFAAAVLLAGSRRWQKDEELGAFEAGAGWLAYFLHAGLVIWAAAVRAWPLADVGPLSFAGGAVLVVVGAAIFAAGALAFRSLSQMQGTDSGALVTWGIYRYSRHPQNVGWGIALMGAAVASLSGLALLLAALYWLAMLFYLRVEERRVEETFGPSYRRYRATTPQLLGRPRG